MIISCKYDKCDALIFWHTGSGNGNNEKLVEYCVQGFDINQEEARLILGAQHLGETVSLNGNGECFYLKMQRSCPIFLYFFETIQFNSFNKLWFDSGNLPYQFETIDYDPSWYHYEGYSRRELKSKTISQDASNYWSNATSKIWCRHYKSWGKGSKYLLIISFEFYNL